MIVPRTRLIVFAAVVGLAAAAALRLEEGEAVAATIALAGVLVAAMDALRARGRLDGFSASLPDPVRFAKDRPAEVLVRLQAPASGRPDALRIALHLPPAFEQEMEDVRVALPRGAEGVDIAWPCTPRVRGRYTLENVYVDGPSPWGLWSVYRTLPARGEARVYPNLMQEHRQLSALFLNRGAFGIHAQRQLGKGREFEKLREYSPGDSFEDIHWKATARRGHPVTKEYQVERTQEVYVVVDASRLSARPLREGEPGTTRGATQVERYVSAALSLGLAAERQHDLFGLAAFSDRVLTFVRAQGGKSHFNVCREALYTLQAETVNPNYAEIFSFLRMRLRRRALVVFLTHLDDPALAEQFQEHVDILARRHLVFVNVLTPPGVAPVFSKPAQDMAEVYEHLAGHMRWHDLLQVRRQLQVRNVTMAMFDEELLAVQLVSQYLNLKQRQAI